MKITHKQNRIDRYVFPNIAIWINDNNMTVRSLAEEIGMHPNTICSYLLGKSEPSFFFITQILKVTGMPFEVAFERKAENHGEQA